MTNDSPCYIIGSGRSLLELNQNQIEHINRSQKVIAMNKYYLFKEMINIIPSGLFIADFRFPAHRVLIESVRRAQEEQSRLRLYCDHYYHKLLFSSSISTLKWNLRERVRLWRRNRYLPPLHIQYDYVTPFSHRQGYYGKFKWAKSLHESLYWLHGSLTTAINLANIIYPGSNIVLVGVDLKDSKPFYYEEIEQRKDLQDPGYLRNMKQGIHNTAVAQKDGVTMLDALRDWIVPELEQQGVTLSVVNADSLLAEQNICCVTPIPEH